MATSFASSGPAGRSVSFDAHAPPAQAAAFPEGDAWTAEGVGVGWTGKPDALGPTVGLAPAAGLGAGLGTGVGAVLVPGVGLGELDVEGAATVPHAASRRAATFAVACTPLSTTMPASTESRSAGGRSATRTPVVWSRVARSIGPRFCGSPRNTAT
jgi:hypothetical protein